MTKVSAMWKSPRVMGLSRLTTAIAAVLLGNSAHAQESANLCGTATDLSGAVMAGVTVSLEQRTVAPKTATTAKDGEYIFTNVEPGTYAVTFALDGFKRAVRNGIAMAAGQEFRADIRMEPAGRVEPADMSSASIAYSRPKTAGGSTFTKDISPGALAVRPCMASGQ